MLTSGWGADLEVLKNQQTAEARYLPVKDVKVGWGKHCVARGGTTIVSDVTREFNWDGEQIGHSATMSLSSHSGAVAAVPIGDFEKLEEFAYKSSTGIQTGRLVSVAIQISTGNSTPAELVMQRAVENLVKAGVPLPAAVGAKPGRLLPLSDVAKKRFGARVAKTRYDADSGHVFFLLLDCKPAAADETYLPSTPQGYTRKQREEMAQKLERSEDKGGVRVFATERAIIPAGTPNIPLNVLR